MDKEELLRRLMAQDQFLQEGNSRGANLMQPQEMTPEDKANALAALQEQKMQALGANQAALGASYGANNDPRAKLEMDRANQAEADAVRFGRIRQMLRNQ